MVQIEGIQTRSHYQNIKNNNTNNCANYLWINDMLKKNKILMNRIVN